MRILLVGANGQVGTDLGPALARIGRVIPATRGGEQAGGIALDCADGDAIRAVIGSVTPDVVVNAAAYTAVDRAESDTELAERINHHAPAHMAAACAAVGARFVHYSTDYVFDGRAGTPYRPSDPIAPQGVYGATKARGEAAVRAALPDALVLRTAWVYALHGQNFLRTMLRLGAERDELRVVDDQVGSPTPSWLIAGTTARLLEHRDATGTHHLVCRGRVSWRGFAEAIVTEAAARGLLAKAPVVQGIATADYPTPARRPAFSVLDPASLEALVGQPMPDWRESLNRTFDRAAGAPAMQ